MRVGNRPGRSEAASFLFFNSPQNNLICAIPCVFAFFGVLLFTFSVRRARPGGNPEVLREAGSVGIAARNLPAGNSRNRISGTAPESFGAIWFRR